MKRLAMIVGLVAAVALTSACGSPGRHTSAPESTAVPLEPKPFSTVWHQMRGRDFSVLYEGHVDASSNGVLLWRKAGPIERWDFFFTTSKARSTLSSVTRVGDRTTRACTVYFDSPERAKMFCDDGVINMDFYQSIIDPLVALAGAMKPVPQESILGQSARCYQGGIGGILSGHANANFCLSDAGIALSMDVVMGLHEASLEAITINPAPSQTDLERLLWSKPTHANTPVAVAASQLALPPNPALAAYVDGR